MKKLAIGFAAGLLFGSATSAIAAQMVGDSGYMIGWDITYNGELVCSDPFVWTGIREIECG